MILYCHTTAVGLQIGTKQSIELAYLNTWIMPTFCSGIVYNCTIFVLQNKYMYIVQFPKCFDNVTWLSLNERTNERRNERGVNVDILI